MVKVIEPIKACKLLGAYATVAGINNALPLLHSPCGCQYYLRACLHLHDGIDPLVLTSDISQEEVIFGGEDRLRDAIIAGQASYQPDLIVALSSCAPSLVGDDIEAVAESVRDDLQADVLAVDCAGFIGDQASGFKDVTMKLLAHYAQDDVVARENVVNLIGMIPGFDYRWRFDIVSLIELLNSIGLEVNAVLGGTGSLDRYRTVGEAALNIVLSDVRGKEIAQYLQSRFGTPYIAPGFLPIGMQCIKDWYEIVAESAYLTNGFSIDQQVNQAVQSFEYVDLALATTYTADATAVIVSEPYRAVSLARFLSQDVGIKPVAICLTESNGQTEMAVKEALAQIGEADCRVLMEEDAYTQREVIAELRPTVLFGSTFDRAIARSIGASLIRIGFPSYDEVLMTERPYMGINGIPVLMEDLVNAIISKHL